MAAIFAIALLWLAWIAAHIGWYRYHPPRETAFMAQRLAEARDKGRRIELRYSWVPYSRIATPMKRAMIAAEDAKFVEHSGFDWEGIEQAQEKNRRRGRIVAGGSTITQQLAKNLFLSPAKSYWRKVEEAVITVLLEALLPKAADLRALSQRDRMGQRRLRRRGRGAPLLPRRRAQLTAEQAARLAAMAPAPRVFERNPESAYLAGRVATIIARMPSAQIP